MNEGCKHSEAKSQSDQPTSQTRKCFFAALNVSSIDGRGLSECQEAEYPHVEECTDLEDHPLS